MSRYFNLKSSFWGVAFVAFVLVSAGFLKARQADRLAEPVGINFMSVNAPNLW
jgi:hypothetical protein